MNCQELAGDLKKCLGLNLEPVGVRLYLKDDTVPAAVQAVEPETGLKSYCQGICLAARGQAFYGGREKLGCPLGTSTLGLESDPAGLLEATVVEKHGAGLYETQAASRASVEAAVKFKAGAYRSAHIAPLDQFETPPQVVVLELLPETAMWLLYAANHAAGGAQSLPQSGGVAGGCSDVTVLPVVDGQTNITFLGLGCRLKSGIPPQHLLAGIPADALEDMVAVLRKLSGPMAKLSVAPRLDAKRVTVPMA